MTRPLVRGGPVILEVDRRNLHSSRLVDEAASDLIAGHARLRIDHFALTSNNVSYAAFGDALQYWEFFPPAPASADEPGTEWGRVPVWGFADVVESKHDELAVGRRVYGYLPMGDELVVEPAKLDERGFVDGAAHRRPMATAYNRYGFVDADPGYDAEREAHQMVLYPLFFTSFLIDDFIGDNECFGAATIVISSASSKTAIGTARLLADRTDLRVVGVTSKANVTFVSGLGCYHDILTYDEVVKLPTGSAVYVDIAGNADVRVGVHEHYGDDLAHSMIVGGTHWDHQTDTPPPSVGPTPAFFFAPTQNAKRTTEWGQAGMDERLGAAWDHYSRWVDTWLTFEARRGPREVQRTFAELVRADIDPTVGLVCSIQA